MTHDRRNAAGFTLVEMLVTMAIFAVVAVAVTLVLMNSAKSKQRTTQRIESEQGARAAVDLMARDIRSAGYGDDRDNATPQPAIAYVDQQEIIVSENQLPYPDLAGPTAPLAYNPAGAPKPFTLNATAYTPPVRYSTGAELIRYTLDVNNDGVVDAGDIAAPQGADAAGTLNPNDYVLVREVYGDMTGGVAGNNGGTTERVALVRKPGGGVAPIFNVYMRGSSTAWDWSSGPVPVARLQDIQRIELAVTATASRPDSRGLFAQTVIKTQVNASRSVPDFGQVTYTVSGTVYDDRNQNRVMDGSDVGIQGATVRLGNNVSYSSATGFFQFRVPTGNYVLKHVPAMGFGSFSSPDSFNLSVSTTALTRSFADTARAGGNLVINAFDDLNGNGSADTGEGPLQGIRFTVVPGTPGNTTGYTDSYGNTTVFTGVGGYSVTCNNVDSMRVTTTNPMSGSMSNGGTVSLRFGLNKQLLGITGKVFKDADRSAFNGSETGIGSVWVGLTGTAAPRWPVRPPTRPVTTTSPPQSTTRLTPTRRSTPSPPGYPAASTRRRAVGAVGQT
jgi:prepilin-type N-terminal cleavage/methylation domain-containing protein